MKPFIYSFLLASIAAIAASPAPAQQASAPGPAIKSTVDEVVLDFIARDKKGKPVTDLKPGDLVVTDNGAKEQPTGFRLVQGAEAITQNGTTTKLDPLRQLRLVTLAFEALGDPTQRKTARAGAIDLVKGEQGANVFYSVVVIDTRLMVLQPFTADKDALIKAIDEATSGTSAGKLLPESEHIKSDLKRYLNGATSNGSDQANNVVSTATQVASQAPAAGPGAGGSAVQAKLASIMLDMLRMDAAMSTQDARLSLNALESLVHGLQNMPGRKSVLYFTWGMYLPPELDAIFRSLTSMANRANVTFYSVDTRGVMTYAQNSGATDQLNSANDSSSNSTLKEGNASKDEMRASDNAETSSRANVQLPIRNLAEATGGFLLGESNDLRTPLRHVNEEIASYYEITYNPHIENYDGAFHKLKIDSDRKGLVLQARNGYFALPPESRASGMQVFEMPLLKALSDGQPLSDVEFRSAAFLEQPHADNTSLSVMVEIPLHGLQGKPDATGKFSDVHFSIAALIKDSKGEVVGPRLTRDRSVHVTADQLKMGNFVEKMPLDLPPGDYTMDTVVMDRETNKMGTAHTKFTIAASGKGVGISSLTSVRSYTPNVKGLDPNDTFQFQGGSITPTLNKSVPRVEGSSLRLFFVVYQDKAIAAKPTVEVEFMQNGKSLQKAPLPLPDANSLGRIPYVMTIPAAAIPPGSYQIRATAKQGDTTAVAATDVQIEAK